MTYTNPQCGAINCITLESSVDVLIKRKATETSAAGKTGEKAPEAKKKALQ